MTSMPIAVAIPLLSQQQFSELVGVSHDVVRCWIAKGKIPTVKIGRRRLINVAKLTQEMMELEH
jgi:excisionase family DNA binding protein